MSKINKKLTEKVKENEAFEKIKKKDKPIELVSKLKLDPQRVRKIMSPEETAALALNMKAFGQIEPLIIDQNNEVVHGTRRLEAMKLADIKKAKVIKEDKPEIRKLKEQLCAALHTREVSIYDKAKAIKKLCTLENKTPYAILKEMGISMQLGYRCLALLRATAETLEKIKNKELSERTASMILYRLKDVSRQGEVIDFVISNKMNTDQAGKLVAEINDPKLAVNHIKSYLTQTIRGIKLMLIRKDFLNIDQRYKPKIEKDFREIDEVKDELFLELGWK